jgi:hypothetical protein
MLHQEPDLYAFTCADKPFFDEGRTSKTLGFVEQAEYL